MQIIGCHFWKNSEPVNLLQIDVFFDQYISRNVKGYLYTNKILFYVMDYICEMIGAGIIHKHLQETVYQKNFIPLLLSHPTRTWTHIPSFRAYCVLSPGH